MILWTESVQHDLHRPALYWMRILFRSVQFRSVQFRSVQFRSVQFSSSWYLGVRESPRSHRIISVPASSVSSSSTLQSFKTQATCDGRFFPPVYLSVISLHSRCTVHPHESSEGGCRTLTHNNNNNRLFIINYFTCRYGVSLSPFLE